MSDNHSNIKRDLWTSGAAISVAGTYYLGHCAYSYFVAASRNKRNLKKLQQEKKIFMNADRNYPELVRIRDAFNAKTDKTLTTEDIQRWVDIKKTKNMIASSTGEIFAEDYSKLARKNTIAAVGMLIITALAIRKAITYWSKETDQRVNQLRK